MDGDWAPNRPISIFLAVLAGLFIAIVVVAFAATPSFWERIGEVGALVASVLLLSFVWTGGYDRFIASYDRLVWSGIIQDHQDYVVRLSGFARRGRELFQSSAGRTATFAYAASTLENVIFAPNSGATPAEREAGQGAANLRIGWSSGTDAREQSFAEALRLLDRRAKTNTEDYVAAFRLVRGYFNANYAMAAEYQRRIRQANPLRFQKGVGDEWTRFRDLASALKSEWEAFGMEIGVAVRVEGPYSVEFIGELT